MFPDIRKMCSEAGRDAGSIAITVWFPREDPDLMKRYADLGAVEPAPTRHGPPADVAPKKRDAPRGVR